LARSRRNLLASTQFSKSHPVFGGLDQNTEDRPFGQAFSSGRFLARASSRGRPPGPAGPNPGSPSPRSASRLPRRRPRQTSIVGGRHVLVKAETRPGGTSPAWAQATERMGLPGSPQEAWDAGSSTTTFTCLAGPTERTNASPGASSRGSRP